MVFGLGGALVAWAGSFLIPDHYTSHAVVRLKTEPYSAADAFDRAWSRGTGRDALKSVIESLHLYPAERERMTVEDLIEIAHQDASIKVNSNDTVSVSYVYQEAAGAQAALDAIVEKIVAANREDFQDNPSWGKMERTQAPGHAQPVPSWQFWKPRRYVSTAVLHLNRRPYAIDQAAVSHRADLVRREIYRREQLSRVVESAHLYPGSISRGEYAEAIDELDSHLRVAALAHGEALFMSFTYSDAQQAQTALMRIVDTAIAEDRASGCWRPPATSTLRPPFVPDDPLSVLLANEGSTHTVQPPREAPAALASLASDNCTPRPSWQFAEILDPPNLPEESDGPNRLVIACFGLLLGLGLKTVLA